MATNIYATIVGATQGAFSGEGTGNAKDKIPGVAFDYGLTVPTDPASGLVSGKRQYKPVTFTKEWGAASPQIFQAAVTNETLRSVNFEFTSVDSSGVEQPQFIISLANAIISGFEGSVTLGEDGGPAVDDRELERIQFDFQKITITSIAGGTTAVDDWKAGA